MCRWKIFEVVVKVLLSDLKRKTIEPIVLTLLGEKEDKRVPAVFLMNSLFGCDQLQKQSSVSHVGGVRGRGWLFERKWQQFSEKGKHSVGVARQYCGQIGKVENCQAGRVSVTRQRRAMVWSIADSICQRSGFRRRRRSCGGNTRFRRLRSSRQRTRWHWI